MLTGFPPVETSSSRVLILGTMPGAESLRRQEYYGFAHNAFWPIMAELLGFEPGLPYSDRCEKIARAGIALWDVLKSCRRKGSLDSDIRNETPNDFAAFFENHSKIEAVFFNGGNAQTLFKRHVLTELPHLEDRISFHRLPSTSPANARLRFQQKLQKWRKITELLEI